MLWSKPTGAGFVHAGSRFDVSLGIGELSSGKVESANLSMWRCCARVRPQLAKDIARQGFLERARARGAAYSIR
ncbi:hypothetical protein GCM10023318_51820 [Nocardia callitridis]|uniref:Uncharacterized protein n=1 Tax=Nocardia callitridis TaxID=648753 RepID=A0ABP9KV06_9NOCA